MANIKTHTKQVTAIDGASMECSADLGVLFGCHRGVCGKCATTVVSGLNNLSEPTEEEQAMDLDSGRRLMCQARIHKGTVHLDIA